MWVPGRGILNGMGMYSLVWSRECGVVSVWFESAIRAFCCVSFVAINSACKVQTLARVSHQEVINCKSNLGRRGELRFYSSTNVFPTWH